MELKQMKRTRFRIRVSEGTPLAANNMSLLLTLHSLVLSQHCPTVCVCVEATVEEKKDKNGTCMCVFVYLF